MNREQKRLLQRQGRSAPTASRSRRRAASPAPAPSRRGAHLPRQFLHEVSAELRKVAWPTRAETINYSIVVLVALVVLTLIFVLDYVFANCVLTLFNMTSSSHPTPKCRPSDVNVR